MNKTSFSKGHTPWNKGLNKTDSRVAQYGISGSKTKLELSKKGLLPISWNKGLTKNTDSRLARLSELTSKRRKGTKLSKKWTESMSRAYRKQYANGERKWWGLNPKNKEILERVITKLKSEETRRKAFKALRKKPNVVEKYLDEILQKHFPYQWKFTGNGAMMINRKFPDFTNINGQKKVILVNGAFWHISFKKRDNLTRKEIEKIERKPYEDFGYKVLHIWEDELINRTKGGKPIFNKDLTPLLTKIKQFGIKSFG